MDKGNVVFNPDAKLTGCTERTVTLALPGPLNERLDRLVELADEDGARTNRKELLAALLLDAPETPERLAALVKTLRKARARDAAVADDLGAVLAFRRHQPGPRKKAGAG